MRLDVQSFLVKIVNLVLGVISLFLLGRIVLKLLSANPTTPFVAWVYRVTDSLLAPFMGMLPNLTVAGLGVVDIVAIIGLTIYLIIGYLVTLLITALTPPVIETTDRLGVRHYHQVDRRREP